MSCFIYDHLKRTANAEYNFIRGLYETKITRKNEI